MPRPLLWIGLVVAIVAAGVAAFYGGRALSGRGFGGSPELGGTELREPPQLAEPLLDAEGRERTLAQIAADGGRDVLLVYFGYTRCPDVCPLTMARLAQAYRNEGEPDDVGVIMVTVDPDHDTPELVQTYVSAYHPDFLGLSGDTGSIARAARSFFIGVRDAGSGLVEHTDVVAVVDADGRMRRIYGQDDLPELGRDLPRLARSL